MINDFKKNPASKITPMQSIISEWGMCIRYGIFIACNGSSIFLINLNFYFNDYKIQQSWQGQQEV